MFENDLAMVKKYENPILVELAYLNKPSGRKQYSPCGDKYYTIPVWQLVDTVTFVLYSLNIQEKLVFQIMATPSKIEKNIVLRVL